MPQWMALNTNIDTEGTKWNNEFKNKEHMKLKRKWEEQTGILEEKKSVIFNQKRWLEYIRFSNNNKSGQKSNWICTFKTLVLSICYFKLEIEWISKVLKKDDLMSLYEVGQLFNLNCTETSWLHQIIIFININGSLKKYDPIIQNSINYLYFCI